MKLVRSNDGTIITEEAYRNDKTWEGGSQEKSDRQNLVMGLTTVEKLELRTFEQENAKTIGEGGRREMFRQHAARELIAMRQENDERRKQGKELINKEDRKLTLRDGVVKSQWRAKREAEENRQTRISDIARFNEDCRA